MHHDNNSTLPWELVSDILSIAIPLHLRPTSILLVSSHFYRLSLHLLYRRLCFSSFRQVDKFIRTFSLETARVPYPPRAIEIDVDNDTRRNIFSLLKDLFLICNLAPGAEVDQQGKLVLDLLKLRLHSLSQDPNHELTYHALYSINPREFIWTGRDPPHHFSIAIVPQVLPHLFRALATYTHLTCMVLTHLSFGSSEDTLRFPSIPSLQELYIGQATFVSPSKVATYLLSSGAEGLKQFRLVDTYVESIWGFRLRRADIEKAVMAHIGEMMEPEDEMRVFPTTQATDKVAELVRRLVVCEGKTERIIGGDRLSGNTLSI